MDENSSEQICLHKFTGLACDFHRTLSRTATFVGTCSPAGLDIRRYILHQRNLLLTWIMFTNVRTNAPNRTKFITSLAAQFLRCWLAKKYFSIAAHGGGVV